MDDYSTLQEFVCGRGGRLLALGSQVQVCAGGPIICSRVGHFKEGVGDKKVTLARKEAASLRMSECC